MTDAAAVVPSATKRPIWALVEKHLALTIGLGLVLLAVLKVYWAAGFHLPTALSVLAIVDRTQLLTATVLSAATIVVPIAFINPMVRRWALSGNKPGAPFTTKLRTAVLVMPLLTVVVFGLSIPMLGGWLLGWIIVVVWRGVARQGARKKGLEPPAKGAALVDGDTSLWLIATVIGFTMVTVLSTPWLAREAITTDSQVIVGQVIGEQSGMTLLVTASASSAQWIKTDSIEERQLCRNASAWYTATLAALLPREGQDCTEILRQQRED